ncbi:phosphate signaling complex protein PhoU [Limosilactobacillus pontis]|uniref:phosphate signaling complex protein PhoU n=1 Tax=Limosilactobacillus pontis TaxID=35787 RepID=UPI001DBE29C8|nr:phosphate signaling complex protein PhoU [Limosilactobacillus pontis]HJE26948.1 phosphate signaling complex protein PhoU [Limosilactobacillus pontis]
MGAIFNDELKRLRGHFMEMGIDASEQIYQATKAFTENDPQLAKQVLAADTRINDEEVKLEKEALKLMALQQPVASDFRKIIGILKASSDIERLGDYATHIARAAIDLNDRGHNPTIEEQIEQMMMMIREMLERVLDAYAYTNEQLAYEVANKDIQVDMIYVQQQQAIMTALTTAGANVKPYGDYLSVIRFLERAGDHIVNLAEWVIYIGSGKLVELNPGKADPDMVKRKLSKK